jgi:uncharacterized protein
MVPALVLFGVPILSGIAVAQAQSIFIALFATVGYSIRGEVDWPLALFLSVPLGMGALVGWKFVLSHRTLSSESLRMA